MKLNRNHIRKIITEEIKRLQEIMPGDQPRAETPPYIPDPSLPDAGGPRLPDPGEAMLSIQEIIEAMEDAIRNSGATGQVCLDAAMVERVVKTLTGLNPFR
tara:strand:+ start:215 stop:517 length:303 start_codon:yes stop_codon:yes gene_type:complete